MVIPGPTSVLTPYLNLNSYDHRPPLPADAGSLVTRDSRLNFEPFVKVVNIGFDLGQALVRVPGHVPIIDQIVQMF